MMRQIKPTKEQLRMALTVFMTAAAILIFSYLLYNGRSFVRAINAFTGHLTAILCGIVIAYVLSPIQNFLEHYLIAPLYMRAGYDAFNDLRKKRVMRRISVTITMGFFVLLVYSLIAIIGPQLYMSVRTILYNLPVYTRNINRFFSHAFEENPEVQANVNLLINKISDALMDFVQEKIWPQLTNIIQIISTFALNVATGIINFFVGAIIATYLLYSKDKFCAQGKQFAYAFFSERTANEIVGECRYIHYTFIGFITGKIVDSIIIGLLCFLFTSLLKTPFPVLVSFIVGITNVIPFFGPYIGGIVGGILVFMINPLDALVFIVMVILLQQFDGNILGPKILGDSTGLTSFWVIFAIMFFGALWGLAGWVIGVPLFAVIYHGIGRWITHLLRKRALPSDTETYKDVAYFKDGRICYLHDYSNKEFNARQPASSWSRIFKFRRGRKCSGKDKSE